MTSKRTPKPSKFSFSFSAICPRSYGPLEVPAGLGKYTARSAAKESTRVERIKNHKSFAIHHASRISLKDLPYDILLCIADVMSQRELSALARTSRSLYECLGLFLYQRDMKVDGLRTCFWSIEQGHTAPVSILLDAGLNPNARETWSFRGATPLHWAALHGNGKPDVAELLIERGADIESEDYRGYTPFQLAIERGNQAMVQVLIESGVNGGHTNFEKYDPGCTALHVASYLGHPGIVQLLLEAGEDIEAQDSRGRTPLHWATKPPSTGWDHGRTAEGMDGAIEMLLDYGANPDIGSDRSRYPVQYARRNWGSEPTKGPVPIPLR